MKAPKGPAILLFRGRGLISAAIRWQTRSVYSHAAIRMRDGMIVEAWQGDGVRVKELADETDVEAFDVVGASDRQWDVAIAFALGQVGCRYDYAGVARFVTRAKGFGPDRRWFCSELVFAAMSRAGVQLLSRVDAENVSPAMLGFSPVLVPMDTGE